MRRVWLLPHERRLTQIAPLPACQIGESVLKDTAEALASEKIFKKCFLVVALRKLSPRTSTRVDNTNKTQNVRRPVNLSNCGGSSVQQFSSGANLPFDTRRLSGPAGESFLPLLRHHHCFLSYFPSGGINLPVFCSLMLSSAMRGPLFAGLSSALQHVCTGTFWSPVYLLAEWECQTHLLLLLLLCFSVLLLLYVISVFIRCMSCHPQMWRNFMF